MDKILIESEIGYLGVDPTNVNDLISALRLMAESNEFSCPNELYSAVADKLEEFWNDSKEACSWTAKNLSLPII